MKKLAILLSLVMVLGLAVSASAADVTGSIKYEMEKVGDADATWAPTVELAIGETVQGATANLEFDGDTLEYAWVDFSDDALPVKLTFGEWDWYDSDVKGIAATYKVDALTLSGLYDTDPTNEDFGFYGEYAPTFDALAVKAYAKLVNDETTLSGKGTYDLSGFKVWADAKKVDDGDVLFKVGAETTVADITLKGQYDLDLEAFKFDASKKYNGLTFAASYETDFAKGGAPQGESRIKASAKVAF